MWQDANPAAGSLPSLRVVLEAKAPYLHAKDMCSNACAVLHFPRMAYESRAARVAVVRDRNARREARRALRALGGAEKALMLAECGVPLVPVKAPSRSR